MREIKFRGKALNEDKFVCGDLFRPYDDIHNCWIVDFPKSFVEQIDSSTLGQYIGRVDKNGVKVYEGDILKVYDTYQQVYFIGYVDFEHCSFCIKEDTYTHFRWADYEVEVIGNIYENKELLEPDVDQEPAPLKIKGWEDLVGLENENYKLDINLESGNGWIRPKNNDDEWGYYLSTHTFYELNYKESTEILQKYGFNVELEAWGVKMKAQAMFEELGFELNFYQNGNQMCYEDSIDSNEDVCFDINEKELTTTIYTLSPDLIRAINNQCQELGWIE